MTQECIFRLFSTLIFQWTPKCTQYLYSELYNQPNLTILTMLRVLCIKISPVSILIYIYIFYNFQKCFICAHTQDGYLTVSSKSLRSQIIVVDEISLNSTHSTWQ